MLLESSCLPMFMNEYWTHCTCGGVVATSDIDVDDIEYEYLTGSDRLGVSSFCAKNRGEGINRTYGNKEGTPIVNERLTSERAPIN